MGSPKAPPTIADLVTKALSIRPPWCRRCRVRMRVVSVGVVELADEVVIYARCDRHGENERLALGGLDALRVLIADRDFQKLAHLLDMKCFAPAPYAPEHSLLPIADGLVETEPDWAEHFVEPWS